MLLIVFVAFAALIVAWLVAPNGEERATVAVAKPVEPAVPSLKVGEARA